MILWDIKSTFYSGARNCRLFKWILYSELNNLDALLSDADLVPDRILDLGTGTGDALAIYPDTSQKICVDRSSGMLSKAQTRFPQAFFVRASVCNLPFICDRIRFVSMIGLLEYIQDFRGLLRDCYQISESSGHLLLTNARPTVLNRMRQCLGHRIYVRSLYELKEAAGQIGWKLIGNRSSLLQDQCLFQK